MCTLRLTTQCVLLKPICISACALSYLGGFREHSFHTCWNVTVPQLTRCQEYAFEASLHVVSKRTPPKLVLFAVVFEVCAHFDVCMFECSPCIRRWRTPNSSTYVSKLFKSSLRMCPCARCCAVLCDVIVMLCCYVMLCYVVLLCCVMLCCVMLCYVMLCYVMLCYVMLCNL